MWHFARPRQSPQNIPTPTAGGLPACVSATGTRARMQTQLMLTYIYRSNIGLGTGPGKAQAWWMWLGSHVSLHPHHAAAAPGTYYVKVVSPCRECFRGPWAVPGAVTPTGTMNPVISREGANPCLGHPFPQTSLSAAALMPTCSSFPSLTQQINFNSKLTLFFCWLACQMRARQIFPLAHSGGPAPGRQCGDSQGCRLPIEGTRPRTKPPFTVGLCWLFFEPSLLYFYSFPNIVG